MFSRSCLRHCRRSNSLVRVHVPCVSTFLPPLAPRALARFVATMEALTPAQRLFGPSGHEHRSGPGGSPCLLRPHFQPFCPQPPRRLNHAICSRSQFVSVRDCMPVDHARPSEHGEALPCRSWHRLRTALAGSPVGAAESGLLCVMSVMSRRYGPVVHFRQLSTPCRHGCSSLRLQAGERSAWRGLAPRCVYAITGALGRALRCAPPSNLSIFLRNPADSDGGHPPGRPFSDSGNTPVRRLTLVTSNAVFLGNLCLLTSTATTV